MSKVAAANIVFNFAVRMVNMLLLAVAAGITFSLDYSYYLENTSTLLGMSASVISIVLSSISGCALIKVRTMTNKPHCWFILMGLDVISLALLVAAAAVGTVYCSNAYVCSVVNSATAVLYTAFAITVFILASDIVGKVTETMVSSVTDVSYPAATYPESESSFPIGSSVKEVSEHDPNFAEQQ